MTKGELDRLEELLLGERDRALADLHQVEAEEREPQAVSSGEVVRFQEEPADAASYMVEQEKDFSTASRLSTRVAQLDDALRLLAKDPSSLVICGDCGGLIGTERLLLVPASRRCSACARRADDVTRQGTDRSRRNALL